MKAWLKSFGTRWHFAALAFLTVMAWLPAAWGQPPGMPDPRRMSGIPRVDATLPAGTVTVRCLLGSFAEPAIGIEVELALTPADGGQTTTKMETTVEKGRATFRDLTDFIGGSAVASVTLDGAVVRSATIPIDARAGTAVLLVKGAATPTGAAPPRAVAPTRPVPPAGDPHGAAAAGGAGHVAGMPEPGRPFPLRERPEGTLIVGVFDLSTSQPVAGASARLMVDLPGDEDKLEPIDRQSGADGRVLFEELVGERYPSGTRFRVEAVAKAGEDPQVSEWFEMTGGHGWALVFIKGRAAAAGDTAASPRPMAARPRGDASLAPGTVAVHVLTAKREPVADLAVTLVHKTMMGLEQRYPGRTDQRGVATIANVPVANDAVSFAVAPYEEAPFRSSSFRLEPQRGARVEVMVYPVTGDVHRIRSAAQFDIAGLEDDQARVLQMYEAVLEGDAAFWVPGFRVHAAAGGTGVRVMRGAETYLREIEDAPYAELVQPLLPGQRLVLSTAYLMRHDGELELDWHAPFPINDARASMQTELRVESGAAGPPEAPKSEVHGPPVYLYPLTVDEYVDGPCQQAWKAGSADACDAADTSGGAAIGFVVAGLPAQSPLFRYLAIGVGGLLAVAVAVGLVAGGRVTQRDSLLRKRDALLARVQTLDAERDRGRFDRAIAALDRIYRQLDALEDGRVADQAGAESATRDSSS
ncbi:MAG: hypothetical protein B7733_02960 [Myxococcales bacterium FL481]|nr:MAG: hypothetical protein B7733_02960 [Myxococcales bacterium FL481]